MGWKPNRNNIAYYGVTGALVLATGGMSITAGVGVTAGYVLLRCYGDAT